MSIVDSFILQTSVNCWLRCWFLRYFIKVIMDSRPQKS
jgi:hypothetical protein